MSDQRSLVGHSESPFTDFSNDSMLLRLQAAHYHLRVAQDMAYGQFGGPQAPLLMRLALNRAQDKTIRALNRALAQIQKDGPA